MKPLLTTSERYHMALYTLQCLDHMLKRPSTKTDMEYTPCFSPEDQVGLLLLHSQQAKELESQHSGMWCIYSFELLKSPTFSAILF